MRFFSHVFLKISLLLFFFVQGAWAQYPTEQPKIEHPEQMEHAHFEEYGFLYIIGLAVFLIIAYVFFFQRRNTKL